VNKEKMTIIMEFVRAVVRRFVRHLRTPLPIGLWSGVGDGVVGGVGCWGYGVLDWWYQAEGCSDSMIGGNAGKAVTATNNRTDFINAVVGKSGYLIASCRCNRAC
jgi:hypothetical protein